MADLVIYGNLTWINLVTAIILIIIALMVGKTINIYIRRALRDDLGPGRLRIISKLINFAVIFFALIIIVPMLGVDWEGLLIAGGIIGLVLAFATQSIISNFISGLFLMMERPMRIGDTVEIDGKEGTVEDIKIFSTQIRGYDGYTYRIPNDKVFTTKLTNFSNTKARRFDYTIGISYSNDAERAIDIVKKILDEHPFVLITPAYQIFVNDLGDSSVNIIIRIWSPIQVWYGVKIELLWKIKTKLEDNGIKIPFPQRTIWFANKADGNTN